MQLDYEIVKNWRIPQEVQTYTPRDTILYALGAGVATVNPLGTDDLTFVYERDLQALPTQYAILASGPFWMSDPQTGIDTRQMLHGEQFLTVHKPLPAQGTVISRSSVAEIYDKGAGKGAVLCVTRDIHDQASDELLATVGYSVFLRANGGFNGPATGAPAPRAIPQDRPCDCYLDLITRPEQNVIYRLSGDVNPLHIDPQVARSVGFDKPILHGLCSYAIAGRAILKLLCEGDPTRLRRLDVRFATPVYPGETLRTEVWREGGGRAVFRVRVLERDVIAMNNGYAEFAD